MPSVFARLQSIPPLIWLLAFAAMPLAAQETTLLESDVSSVEISQQGAYPVSWTVAPMGTREHSVQLVSPAFLDEPLGGPFRLILDGESGPLTTFANTAVYEAEREQNAVRFASPVHDSGLQIIKSLRFSEGYTANYFVVLRNALTGGSVQLSNAAITLGPGIGRVPNAVGGLGDAMYSYVDGVVFDGQDVREPNSTERISDVTWAGIHDRYYALLLRPSGNWSPGTSAYSSITVDESEPEPADAFHPALRIELANETTIAAGEELVFEFQVYAGPKDRTALTDAGYEPLLYSNLPGPLRWLCLKLGDLLRYMYGHIGSWWMTIVAFTVLIRIVLFPLAQKSIKMNAQMMADQAKLKPLIDEIKKKHRDASVQYEKTMALYKDHGINPFAPMFGCLPVLLQLPILIAIFNILGQEVTLQGARFLWVDDLSLPDRLFPLGVTLPYFGAYFNLLPVLMAITMVLTTNLGSPADGDQKKSQTRSMAVLAFIFFALFYSFPAGLVLYWMLSNLGQYAQQEVVTRIVERRTSDEPIESEATSGPESK